MSNMVHYRTKTTKSAITPQKSPPSDSGDGNSETEGRDDTETLPVVGDALQRCDDDSSPPDFKKHSHQHRPHSEVARLRKQRSPQWSALFILLAMIAAVLLLLLRADGNAPASFPMSSECISQIRPLAGHEKEDSFNNLPLVAPPAPLVGPPAPPPTPYVPPIPPNLLFGQEEN